MDPISFDEFVHQTNVELSGPISYRPKRTSAPMITRLNSPQDIVEISAVARQSGAIVVINRAAQQVLNSLPEKFPDVFDQELAAKELLTHASGMDGVQPETPDGRISPDEHTVIEGTSSDLAENVIAHTGVAPIELPVNVMRLDVISVDSQRYMVGRIQPVSPGRLGHQFPGRQR